jgi:hypothetical protein
MIKVNRAKTVGYPTLLDASVNPPATPNHESTVSLVNPARAVGSQRHPPKDPSTDCLVVLCPHPPTMFTESRNRESETGGPTQRKYPISQIERRSSRSRGGDVPPLQVPQQSRILMTSLVFQISAYQCPRPWGTCGRILKITYRKKALRRRNHRNRNQSRLLGSVLNYLKGESILYSHNRANGTESISAVHVSLISGHHTGLRSSRISNRASHLTVTDILSMSEALAPESQSVPMSIS